MKLFHNEIIFPWYSIILYFPIMVLSFSNPLVGVTKVFVAGISSDEGRGEAHFLQNSESDVFSVLHLGHSTPIIPSSYLAIG